MQRFSQETLSRVKRIYKADRLAFYGMGLLSIFVGVKVCDFFFYDETKLLKLREEIEEEYWQTHGFPKNIQPEEVPSYVRPGEMRKTYIKINMGKDQYVAKKEN